MLTTCRFLLILGSCPPLDSAYIITWGTPTQILHRIVMSFIDFSPPAIRFQGYWSYSKKKTWGKTVAISGKISLCSKFICFALSHQSHSHFNLDMKTSWAEKNIVTCAGVVWDWDFQPLWVNPNIWLYLVEAPIIFNPISRFSSPLKWVLNSMAVKNPGTLALTGWLVDVYFLLSMVMTGFDPFPYWLVVWNIFIFSTYWEL